MEILQRELIYIWYYFDIQLRQIFGFWVLPPRSVCMEPFPLLPHSPDRGCGMTGWHPL